MNSDKSNLADHLKHIEDLAQIKEEQWYIESSNSYHRLQDLKFQMERNGRFCTQIRENPNVWGMRWFFLYQREKKRDAPQVLPADVREYEKS